jgi:drug/metabolite transporter (DMT)-like permease
VFVHYLLTRGVVEPTHDGVVLLMGLVMGVFCTVLPSFMINRAIQLIGGQRIGPFNYAGMGLTFVASSMLLDESFTLVKLLGILLAAVGALSLTMGRAKGAKKEAA